MLYQYKDLKRANNNEITYFYQPKGYRKYVSFSKTYGDTMGVPKHHVDLPDKAVIFNNPTMGICRMMDFLDRCFAK